MKSRITKKSKTRKKNKSAGRKPVKKKNIKTLPNKKSVKKRKRNIPAKKKTAKKKTVKKTTAIKKTSVKKTVKPKKHQEKSVSLQMVNLARSLHGKNSVVQKKNVSIESPKTLVSFGELVSVVYKKPNEKIPYRHIFKKNRPQLAASEKGKLYICGGSYKVSGRGII